MTDRVPVIAIDGPTGSGKGTISRSLAHKLGWHLLDSGALYRLVALIAAQKSIALDDQRGLAAAAADMVVNFSPAEDAEQVFLDGTDVTTQLRTEEHAAAASQVALLPLVRAALLLRQRAFAQPPGLVADGRDMGSVVFPDATLKVYLTATPKERALRRYNQLKEKGIDVSLPAVSREIAERDERDANRKVAPLKTAEGAQVLDSTGITPEQVVARVHSWFAGLDQSAS
ncbi:MAG: (d)CMP kinase [Gammaproteobacteria bacterium]|nr:MAG: (d)CMP kinase [Gammaproteobacteria bacterium]